MVTKRPVLHVLDLRRNVKNTKTSMGVFVAKGWGGGEGGGEEEVKHVNEE